MFQPEKDFILVLTLAPIIIGVSIVVLILVFIFTLLTTFASANMAVYELVSPKTISFYISKFMLRLIPLLIPISILVLIPILLPSFILEPIFRLGLAFMPAIMLEIHFEILLLLKIGYFLLENLFINVKNYMAINGLKVIINNSRTTKIHLVCDFITKYQN